jgi:predicted SprT family Zn-dependent metalloprotease
MLTMHRSARAGEVGRLAEQLLAAHGLYGWSFRFNRSKATLGLCRWGARTIELSVYFVERNPLEAVRQTLLHEIAHALAGRAAGHGPAWKAVCLRIGARPERLSFQADMPRGCWQAVCGNCGRLHDRHRRPKRMVGWYCAPCGRERGKLSWAVQSGCGTRR